MNEIRESEIKSAIETIEPATGAKERMFAEIQRKAALKTGSETINTKKRAPLIINVKKWALPAAACLVIALFGATVLPNLFHSHGKSNIVSQTETGNPFVDVSDSSEFERQLGISVDAPDGAKDVSYHIIDGKIADVMFAQGEHGYDLRASKESSDFSGLYADERKTRQIDREKDAVLSVLSSGEEVYVMIEWTKDEVKLILSNTDGASEAEITEVFKKLTTVG